MRCALGVLALVLLLGHAGVALAEDKPSYTEQADRVLAAAKDPEKLRELSKMFQPPIWAVADELSSRGETDVAIALAKASVRGDRKALIAYLESRRAAPTPPGTWARIDALWKVVFSDAARVAKEITPFEKLGGLPAAYAATIHGVAAYKAGDPGVSEPLLHEALRQMEALADRDDTAWVLLWIASLEHGSGRLPATRARYERMLALKTSGYWGRVAEERLARLLHIAGDLKGARGAYLRLLALLGDAAPAGERASILLGLGEVLAHLGEYELADKHLQRAHALFVADDQPGNAAGVLSRIGLLRRLRGDLRGALAAYQSALAQGRKDKDMGQVAAVLVLISRLRLDLGEFAEARRTSAEAVTLFRRVKDPVREAQALSRLGSIHSLLGEPGQAVESLQRALHLLEGTGTGDLVASARALLGHAYAQTGHLARALELYTLAQEEWVRRGIALNMAESARVIAHTLMEQGNYPRALRSAARAMELYGRLGHAIREARAEKLVGMVVERRGEFERPLEIYTRVAALFEAAGREQDLAGTLAVRGTLKSRIGDHAGALADLTRAVQLCGDSGSPLALAPILQSLSTLQLNQGRWVESERLLQRTLKLARSARGRLFEARALNDLSVVARARGDHALSLRLAQQAYEIQFAAGAKAGASRSLANVARCWATLGDTAAARTSFAHSREIAQELKFPHLEAGAIEGLALISAPRESVTMLEAALRIYRTTSNPRAEASCKASIAMMLSRFAPHRALPRYQEALVASEALGDRYGSALVRSNIAVLLFQTDRLAEAHALMEQARAEAAELGAKDLEARILANTAAILPPREGVAAARQAFSLLPMLVGGLAAEQGALARDQWRWLKTNSLVSAVALDSTKDLFYFMESTRALSLLEALGGRAAVARAKIPEAMLEEEAIARARVDGAERRIKTALRRRKRKAVRVARAEAETARAALGEVIARRQREAKAVADVAYPSAASLTEIQATLKDDEALVTYATYETRLGPRAVALVATSKAARIVRLKPPFAMLSLQDPRAPPPASELEALRTQIIKPLKLGANIRRVLLSPDGPLAYVPFALLMPKHEIVYVPSGTTYRMLRSKESSRGKGILALGNPDYKGTKLAPLPASGAEAKTVGTKTLLGKHATPAALQDLASKQHWRAVHFACHGLIDPENPLRARLALSGGSLSVIDIYESNIHADLVVLSACETAQGKVYATEGVVGFVRAFMLAGSPRTLVSLWKVDDEATSALMVEFYERWKTVPAATALRQAQAYVRSQKRWAHPYYWAAWQLWGLPD